jgi:type IV secretion system protein VirB9
MQHPLSPRPVGPMFPRLAAPLLAILAGAVVAAPCWALEAPKANQSDRRMRVISYNPDQVVALHAEVGATVAVRFADTETVGEVAASDRANLKIAPDGSVLFLKPIRAMASQPMFVKTRCQDGSTRLYTFQWQAVDAIPPASSETSPAAGAGLASAVMPSASAAPPPTTDAYYSVRFVYPADVAAARIAAARKAAAERAAERAQAALTATPASGAPNFRYVAQGDGNLVPDQMSDDGQSTSLHFPGNVRLPAVYVISPDGKEAITNYSVESGTITIHQTARAFRLRDGDTVLNIWNQGWDPVGSNPSTGTVSPNVVRTLKRSAR